MSDLPRGWVVTTLGEVASPRGERVSPADHVEKQFIGLEHVEAHTTRINGSIPSTDVKSSTSLFYKGDVLYGRLRPYLNKVAKPDFAGLASAEFIVFPNQEHLRSGFLKHRLNASDFVSFATRLNAGDRPRVDFDQIGDFPILLPPPAEQERIAGKLDELTSDLDVGIAALERAGANLKRYRTAVLKAALEGRLTEKWRAAHPDVEPADKLLEHILTQRRKQWERAQLVKYAEKDQSPPKGWRDRYLEPVKPDVSVLPLLRHGWCWASWSQVGLSQNGRPFPSKEYCENGIRLLRPGNFYATGAIGWNVKNTKCLPKRYAEANPDLIVNGGELVINLTAQSLRDEFLGRTCITSPDERCLLNQRLARLTPILIPSRFMLWVFKSAHFRGFVADLNTGSLIQHMFTSQMERFVFPLPPLPEQLAITRVVEEQLSIIDHLEAQIADRSVGAHALRQAILKRAFEGNLVPQDPSDEPASELLERIRAQRSKDKGARKQAPRGRRRPVVAV